MPKMGSALRHKHNGGTQLTQEEITMSISAESIQRLLVSEDSDVLHSVAAAERVAVGFLQQLRDQLEKRLRGMCPACGRRTRKPVCGQCSGYALDTRSIKDILRAMPMGATVHVYNCSKCSSPAPLDAREALRHIQKYGSIPAERLCAGCMRNTSKGALTFKPFNEIVSERNDSKPGHSQRTTRVRRRPKRHRTGPKA
jgi:hypothetical protein